MTTRRSDPDPPPPGITLGIMSSEERLEKSLGWGLMLVFIAAPALVSLFVGPRTAFRWLVGPSLVLAIVSSAWKLSIQGRQRKTLERAQYRVCLKCRYSLTDLPNEGTCPECGCKYTLEQLQRSWVWTYSDY